MLCLRDAFITIEFESGDTRSMKKYVRPIGMVPKTYQIRKDPNGIIFRIGTDISYLILVAL